MGMLSLTETLSVFFEIVYYAILVTIAISVIYVAYKILVIIFESISALIDMILDRLVNIYHVIANSRILSIISITALSLILISMSPIIFDFIEMIYDFLVQLFTFIASIVLLIIACLLLISVATAMVK